MRYIAYQVTEPPAATLPAPIEGKLRVLEIYKCLQGEGILAGSPSVLVRFAGCSVGCSWCDTKFSWVANKPNLLCDVEDVVRDALDKSRHIKHIIISGGEPLEQPQEALYKLLIALVANGKVVTIETSGVIFPDTSLLSIPNILWSIAPKLPSAKTNYNMPYMSIWITGQMLYRFPLQIKFVVSPEQESFVEDTKVITDLFNMLPMNMGSLSEVSIMLQACTPFSNNLDEDRELLLSRVRLLEQMVTSDNPPDFVRSIVGKNFPLYVRYQLHFMVYGHLRGV